MTFNEYLDIEIAEMTSDVFEMRVPVREEFKTETGVIHGGIIMAIADTATGFLAIDLKYLAPTQSSYTNFLRPLRADCQYIYARAKLIKRGKRTVTLDCEVWGDNDKVAAINRTECTIIDESIANTPSPLIKKFQDGDYNTYEKNI